MIGTTGTIRLYPLLLLGVFFGVAGATPLCAGDETFDTQIYSDPNIPVAQVEKVFHKRLTSVWLQALARPEHDLQRQAASAIALAHRKGQTGLEQTVPPLLRALDHPDQHITVRLAAAQALIELDARDAAPSLFAHVQRDGVDMRNVVEPALARWDYQPMRAVWLERINQPGLAAHSWIMAIQGLATVHELKAIPRLKELVMAPNVDPIIRIEAAKALGSLRTSGLEKDAERLAVGKAGPENASQLAAAELLRKHRGAASARILERLALEAEPAAAWIALDGLLQDDPRRVVLLIPRLKDSRDAGVRERCIEGFHRNPSMASLPLIADLMDDPHPLVRTSARKALADVAKNAEFREAVLAQATRQLASESWRVLEQTTILMVNLDRKAAAPRFVQLLQNQRGEVYVAAAWGLRKLAVPETLPDQLREVERRLVLVNKGIPRVPHEKIDEELAQLCESLGRAKYAPAAPALARFIPKKLLWIFGPQSRRAAVWALGLVFEKVPPPDSLVKALIERMNDLRDLLPDDQGVRTMCAIALGRMKAKAAIDDLNMSHPEQMTSSPLTNACAWALEQITGKKQPISKGEWAYQTGWFLEPDRR
ncbi:MAG TPA: HEAT repeat domain-containing protein [Gemmataceae bacterium]|jgi:HEAT repeat protein|nr:HEAT repeat domain-containing protein [Gemmataceae bacterium]